VTVVVCQLSKVCKCARGRRCVVPLVNLQRPRLRLLSNPVNEKVHEDRHMDSSSDANLDTFCDISPLA
jgi:hypothetical protein